MDVPARCGLSGRLRRVRRKPGLEQLGIQGDGSASSSLWKKGHVRGNTRSDSMSAGSDIATSSAQGGPTQGEPQFDLEDSEGRQILLAHQRALWESTLPRLPLDHIGYFASAQDLDRVHDNDTL
ncbi:hypothetical protein NX059_005729 [Plenodomus lindquistii]|nr:hypothetical protein NX059_005729 [Plenodomus lindquistii]